MRHSFKVLDSELLAEAALRLIFGDFCHVPAYSPLCTLALRHLGSFKDLRLLYLLEHTHAMRISMVLFGYVGTSEHFASGLA